MKLLVGLGNPGEKYKNTRHNTGFMFIDQLHSTICSDGEWDLKQKFSAVVCSSKSVDFIMAKPQTFMNSSGIAVKSLTTLYKLLTTNLYVIHDDLDIPLGKYKIQFGKGPELHYGVKSIEEELGTKDFWRIRIGIDNRPQKMTNDKSQIPNGGLERTSGEVYTLQEFSEEEKVTLKKVIEDIVQKIQ